MLICRRKVKSKSVDLNWVEFENLNRIYKPTTKSKSKRKREKKTKRNNMQPKSQKSKEVEPITKNATISISQPSIHENGGEDWSSSRN